jgi:hypothetical protein
MNCNRAAVLRDSRLLDGASSEKTVRMVSQNDRRADRLGLDQRLPVLVPQVVRGDRVSLKRTPS